MKDKWWLTLSVEIIAPKRKQIYCLFEKQKNLIHRLGPLGNNFTKTAQLVLQQRGELLYGFYTFEFNFKDADYLEQP